MQPAYNTVAFRLHVCTRASRLFIYPPHGEGDRALDPPCFPVCGARIDTTQIPDHGADPLFQEHESCVSCPEGPRVCKRTHSHLRQRHHSLEVPLQTRDFQTAHSSCPEEA